MATKTYDTIILGAGWSGSVAARELANKGRTVLVLEARDRVGGRARTWVDSAGASKIDLGCSWIHGYNEGNPAKEIAHQVGIKAHLPKPAEGVIYGPQGPLPADTANALRSSLSSAQASIKLPHPSPPSTASLASALFSSSSSLFVDQDKSLAEALARTLEVPLGLKLENASLKWAGWETTTSFAGSDAAPEGGYQAFVKTVLDDSKADVQLSKKVSSVSKKDSESESLLEVKTADGETYQGKTVISTIPLGVLKTLPDSFFRPALPPRFVQAVKGTHVGVLEKLLLKYDSAWWPSSDTVGSYTFLPIGPAPNDNSSIQEIFNGSSLITANFAAPSLPGPKPILLTYLSETPAKLLLKRDPQQVIEGFHAFLVSRFGSSSAPAKPVDGELTNWLTDEYAYGATTTPSIVSDHDERSPMDFKELSRPAWDGRLGFAGEHTEMEHRGSVAGAVVSGYREAERVDRLLNLIKA